MASTAAKTILMNLCVIFLFYPVIECEIFTSTNDIKKLSHTEEKLYHEIDNYINRQQNQLVAIRKSLDNIKSQIDKINLKGNDQKDHPIASFLLIKRFLTSWKRIQKKISQQSNATGLFMSESIYLHDNHNN